VTPRGDATVLAIIVDTSTGEWLPINPFFAGSWEHPKPDSRD
jgi:hypothetical protein